MKLFEICQPSLLLEGGKAIKGVSKITQAEVKATTPDLLKTIGDVLELSSTKIKLIGSAGKKPQDSDLSGDLDIAVEIDPGLVEKHLKKLAGVNEYRVMRGINVFSFAHPVGDKLVQVDLIPVDNINFAEWSYQANSADLAQGLKGAQRNELFFAIAKHMPQEVLKSGDDGEPVEIKRYFYDLSRGVMTGTRSRINAKGKVGKNFATVDKKVLSNDPVKICQLLFGKGVTPEQASTFDGTLKAIKSPKFPHREKTKEILQCTLIGIKNKGLKIPHSLIVQ